MAVCQNRGNEIKIRSISESLDRGRRMIKQIGKFLLVITILLTNLFSGTSQGAELLKVRLNQIIQSGNSAFVYMDVVDTESKSINDLKIHELTISYGGEDLELESLENFNSVLDGSSYIFVIDLAKSLKNEQLTALQAELIKFVEQMSSSSYVALLVCKDEVSIQTDFTKDKEQLIKSISALKQGSNQSVLFSGLVRALEIAKRDDSRIPLRKSIIVATDGLTESKAGFSHVEIQEYLKEGQIPFYLVGIDENKSNPNQNLAQLGSLMRLSGGEIFYTDTFGIPWAFSAAKERAQGGYKAEVMLKNSSAKNQKQLLEIKAVYGGKTVQAAREISFFKTDITSETLPIIKNSWYQPYLTSIEYYTSQISPIVLWSVIVTLISIFFLILFLIYRKTIMRKRINAKTQSAYLDPREKYPEPIKDFKQMPARMTPNMTSDSSKTMGLLKKPDQYDADKTQPLVRQSYFLNMIEVGDGETREFEGMIIDSISIGRSKNNGIVINDKTVSAMHCEISVGPEGLVISDKGSLNGTEINGERISEYALFKSGDRIKIGRIEMLVSYSKQSATV